MDPDSIVKIVTLVCLLILSAFFSSAETALTTCNKVRLKTLADGGDKAALRVIKITSNPGKMLGCILIGNNLVNISASALTTIVVQNLLGNKYVSVGTGVLTLLVLIFGEITPKTMASLKADKMACNYSMIILALMFLLTPFIAAVNFLSNIVLRLFGVDSKAGTKAYTEKELRNIVAESNKGGEIEDTEKKYINNIFDFGDAKAKDIMIPRVDMCVIDFDATYEEVIDILRKERYTRIPVMKGDDVLGIINIKDLILYNQTGDFVLKDFIRPVYYTYEQQELSQLMLETKKCAVNVIIVLDEYGVTTGLITMEDLIEELVGEIRDEYDYDEEEIISRVGDNEFLIDAQINLDDLNDALELGLESKAYDSLGGFIIEQLDRLAEVKDVVNYKNYTMIVEKMDHHRIEKVRFLIHEKKSEEESEDKEA